MGDATEKGHNVLMSHPVGTLQKRCGALKEKRAQGLGAQWP
jgi:hypothetical protein